MFRTNVDKLVKISVFGEIASPVVGRSIYNVSAEGFSARERLAHLIKVCSFLMQTKVYLLNQA